MKHYPDDREQREIEAVAQVLQDADDAFMPGEALEPPYLELAARAIAALDRIRAEKKDG